VSGWGSFDGHARYPCPEQPERLIGLPIGQYHCPICGDMQIAGLEHLRPDDDWEREMCRLWPPGYEGDPDEGPLLAAVEKARQLQEAHALRFRGEVVG
jgi:hypothetical protein